MLLYHTNWNPTKAPTSPPRHDMTWVHASKLKWSSCTHVMNTPTRVSANTPSVGVHNGTGYPRSRRGPRTNEPEPRPSYLQLTAELTTIGKRRAILPHPIGGNQRHLYPPPNIVP